LTLVAFMLFNARVPNRLALLHLTLNYGHRMMGVMEFKTSAFWVNKLLMCDENRTPFVTMGKIWSG